jgi:hypothetical protein
LIGHPPQTFLSKALRKLTTLQEVKIPTFKEFFELIEPSMFSKIGYKRDMTASKDKTEFCTVQEAALISGLSLKTWYQGGAGTDVVPRVRFGRSIRLLRSDVEKFICDRVKEAKYVVQQKA